MEDIKNAISIPALPIREHVKVSDLIYFDGPLLSHFQTTSNDHYLFYWVDVNDEYNRWLIVRVTIDRLQSYINGFMSLRNLITKPEDGIVYKVDINEDLEYHNVQIVFVDDLPENYVPAIGTLYKFKPTSAELDLSIYSKRYNSGILQAYFKNSEKTPYGEIDFSLFGSAMNSLSEMRTGLSKVFVAQRVLNAPRDEKGKPTLSKNDVKRSTQLNYFANAGGSFSALLKPASNEIGLEGMPTLQDGFMEFFLEFINASGDYKKISEFVSKIDGKIIKNYKDLLNSIVSSKLSFFLKWENSVTNIYVKESIGYERALDILNVIEKLEFEDIEEVKMTGKFTALNTKTGKYEFQEIDDDENISKGKMDKDRTEMSYLVDFTHTYDIVVKRKTTKETGNKNPKTTDELVSFVKLGQD